MWSLIATLQSEADSTAVAESVLLPVEGDYNCWAESGISLDGFDLFGNRLILNLLLECNGKGRILITSFPVDCDSFVYHEQVIPEQKSSLREANYLYDSLRRIHVISHVMKLKTHTGIRVEFAYVAYKYHDLDDSTTPLGQIHISSLSIEYDLRPYMQNIGHKVTCLFNSIYLGRAQECITLRNGKRFLSWCPNPASDGWMSPRSELDFDRIREEATDMSLIRMADPSGCASHKSTRIDDKHVPDNDAFQNTIFKMPRFHRATDAPIRLQFFNFKFIPPRSIECVVKWADFENHQTLIRSPRTITPRGFFRRKPKETITFDPQQVHTLEKQLLKNVLLRISYLLFQKEQRVKLLSVKLHIDHFEQSLNFIDLQNSKTV